MRAGIISCIAFSPAGDLMAAGAYSGIAAVYDPRSLEMLLSLSGHAGGITQVCQCFLPPAVSLSQTSMWVSGSRRPVLEHRDEVDQPRCIGVIEICRQKSDD